MVEASISSPEFHLVKISKKKQDFQVAFLGLILHSRCLVQHQARVLPVVFVQFKVFLQSHLQELRYGLGFCPLTIIDPQKRWENDMIWSCMIGMGKSYIQKWMVKTSRSPRPLVLDDSDEGTYLTEGNIFGINLNITDSQSGNLTLFGINLIVGLDFS